MRHKAAWKIFRKWCKYHPNPEDTSKFKEFLQHLESKQSFHVARYNDGEWIWMLKIEPSYTRSIRRYGADKQEVEKISSKLLEIVDNHPDYYIGVDSTTRKGQGLAKFKKHAISQKLAKVKNLIYGDVFNAAFILLGIMPLKTALKDRHVISVGPGYMPKLRMSKYHIKVPIKSCWVAADQIKEALKKHLDQHIDEHPVILYSCSMLAKYLIDVNYHQYKNKITQLDLGSSIDAWCGLRTRPWHCYIPPYSAPWWEKEPILLDY